MSTGLATFGPAYSESLDGRRLATQFNRILELMSDGAPRTLRDIQAILGYSEASIRAQLRHARRPKFGLHQVEKRRRLTANGFPSGTWEYQVVCRPATMEKQSVLAFGEL